MAKRNFFDSIFGKKINVQPKQLTSVQMLNSMNSTIYNYSGTLYDCDTVRTSIDAVARHFAKMQPEHRLKNTTVNSALNRLLTYRPNQFMSTYDFLYKTVTQLYLYSTAFVYIERDDLGTVKSLYPIDFGKAELKQDNKGIYYLRFQFYNGRDITVDTADLIVLRRFFGVNDFYGEGNYNALYGAVNLLFNINEGTINAIKSSAYIRGIVTLQGMVQPSDRKEKRDSFMEEFLTAQNNGGIVVSDDTSKYTPIENKPILIDNDSANSAKTKIYNYYGINEKIVTGQFSDTEYQAFYESVLEPMAIQFYQEFSVKIFTQRELDFGNEIAFIGDRLSYLSTEAKVKMFMAIKELGIINKGTTATIFNLPIPPDADKYLQSLNFVNAEKADQYQLGEEKTGGEKDDKTSQ